MTPSVSELVRRLEGLLPQTAIILGSGLASLVERVDNPVRVPYGELSGFPQSGVTGHTGEIVAGYLSSVPVILLSGRIHYYEKGDAAAMRLPLETLKGIGVRRLIATNAAGSLRDDIGPGSVMMLNDHINFAGANPLIGEKTDARFVGMTSAYDPAMRRKFSDAAGRLSMTLPEGVYMWFSGPSFETPAEIRAARIMGADAVGMSTVPEVILARFLGLECAAFSVITNFAAGMTGAELSHQETKEFAPQGGQKLGRLIAEALKEDWT